MEMNEERWDLLEKFAELIGCNWFSLYRDEETDEYQVFDTEQKKFYGLWEGIIEMYHYNFDVAYMLTTNPCYIVFKHDDELNSICLYDRYTGKKIKASVGHEKFMKGRTVEELNNILTSNEREMCRDIIDYAKRIERLTRDRLETLLVNAIFVIEEMKGCELLSCGLDKQIQIKPYEYSLLKKLKKDNQ